MYRHQNAGQNHNIKMANGFFENVTKLKYLGMAVSNQNFIYEEITSRLNFDNTCCDSVQNPLPSRLLSEHVKFIVHKIIILTPVLYGREM
jgi:hypothetical protein